ncbi:uncharacterized protein LOC143235354 [Tachypleus tridentatus]|uniref:uncharacterized protein LOC143235354 n=1 Tax=Tachypleus tridentatus TaxID=6853 RepID=UPI003FD5E3FB
MVGPYTPLSRLEKQNIQRPFRSSTHGKPRQSGQSKGLAGKIDLNNKESPQTTEAMDEDVLVCGKCSTAFNNIHYFIDHKTSACKSLEGAVSMAESDSDSKGSSSDHAYNEYKKDSTKLKHIPAVKLKVQQGTLSPKSGPSRSGSHGRAIQGKITPSRQKEKQQTPSPKKSSKSNSREPTPSLTPSKRKILRSPSPKRMKHKSSPSTSEQEMLDNKLSKAKKIFSVEKILNKRKHKDKVEYLIKWKNYPDSENCWEPEENILSKDLIEEFEQSIRCKSSPKKRKGQTSDSPSVELKKVKVELTDCSEISHELLVKEDKPDTSSQETSDTEKDKDVTKNIHENQENCTYLSEEDNSKDDKATVKDLPVVDVDSHSLLIDSQTESNEIEQPEVSEGKIRSRRSTSMAARNFIKSVCQRKHHTKNSQKSSEVGDSKLLCKKTHETKTSDVDNDSDSDSSVVFIPKFCLENSADIKNYSFRKYFSYLISNTEKVYLLGRNGKYRGKEHFKDDNRLSFLSNHVAKSYTLVKREPTHEHTRGRSRGRPKGSVRGRGRGKINETINNGQDTNRYETCDVSESSQGDEETEPEVSVKKQTIIVRGAFRSRSRGRGRVQSIRQLNSEKHAIMSTKNKMSYTEKNSKVDFVKKDKKNALKSFCSLSKTRGGKSTCSEDNRVDFVKSNILSGDNLSNLKTVTKKRKVGRPPKSTKMQMEDPNALVNQFGLPPHLEGPPPPEETPGTETVRSQQKNRLFVSMPDKTLVEVNCSDTQKALLKAESKLKAFSSTIPNQEECNTIGLPELEECTLDSAHDSSMSKLPNTVLLIESELPVEEAENKDSFVGVYLFSQIFSPSEKVQKCMICQEKNNFKTVRDLEKHYHNVHDLVTTVMKAQYEESHVFVCIPSNVNENTVLKSKCRFCQALLRNINQVHEHYSSSHGKVVRNIPESQISFLGRFFYCSICSYPSSTITSHLDHMKTVHSMKTFVCRHCNFCSPQPYKLQLHVRQNHLSALLDSKCPACQLHFKDRGGLVSHMQQTHAVQTAPNIWSCIKCYCPCEEENQLAAHLSQCENHQTLIPTTKPEADQQSEPSVGSGTVFYKCNLCSLTFTAEEDIKKHMEEGMHLSPETTENRDTQLSNTLGKSVDSSTTESTCFVCCMRFPTADVCHEHQKHVHMRWVDQEVPDHSYEELPDLKNTCSSVTEIATFKNHKLPVSSTSSEELPYKEEKAQKTEIDATVSSEMTSADSSTEESRALMATDSETSKSKEDGESAIKESSISENVTDTQPDQKTNPAVAETQQNGVQESSHADGVEGKAQAVKRTDFIMIKDVPTNKQLVELGFPSKVGHYCHLCKMVIQSYPLYYMHMYNVHSLEKRFQCIISDCKRTFSSAAAFQCHAQKHNQKSECFCSLCDMVFEDSKNLQDHIFSPQHGAKYIKTQEKYFHSEPRNYRCKVCLSWFGLFAIFVKHMETESHQYRCKYCGLTFVQPGPRRNHIQSIHPEMANVCEICGVKMDSSQVLWGHLSGHGIVHECPKCRRRFLQKEQLSAHMEVHDPPVSCPWDGCTKQLSSKMGLYNHLKSHQEKRDFDCSFCGKAFFKKEQLAKHLETHKEEDKSKLVPSGTGTSVEMKGEGPASSEFCSSNHEMKYEGEHESQNIANKELIQLICATCHKGFDSEEQFAVHLCPSHPNGGSHTELPVPKDSTTVGLGQQRNVVKTSGHLLSGMTEQPSLVKVSQKSQVGDQLPTHRIQTLSTGQMYHVASLLSNQEQKKEGNVATIGSTVLEASIEVTARSSQKNATCSLSSQLKTPLQIDNSQVLHQNEVQELDTFKSSKQNAAQTVDTIQDSRLDTVQFFNTSQANNNNKDKMLSPLQGVQKQVTGQICGITTCHLQSTSEGPETVPDELIATGCDIRLNTYQLFDNSQALESHLGQQLYINQGFQVNTSTLLDTTEGFETNADQQMDTSQDSESSIYKLLEISKDPETDTEQLLDTSQDSESNIDKLLQTTNRNVETNTEQLLDTSQDCESNIDNLSETTNQNIETHTEQLLDTSQDAESNIGKLLETINQNIETNTEQLLDTSQDSESNIDKLLKTTNGNIETNAEQLLDTSQDSESSADKFLEITNQNSETNTEQMLDTSQDSESNVGNRLETINQNIETNTQQLLDTSQDSESNIDKLLEISKYPETNTKQLLDTSQDSESNIDKLLETTNQNIETNREQLLDTSQDSESNIDKLLETTNQNIETNSEQMLDTSQDSESNADKFLEITNQNSETNTEQLLDTSQDSESNIDKFLETSKDSETRVEQLLDTSQASEPNIDKLLETANQNPETKTEQILNANQKIEANTHQMLDVSKDSKPNVDNLLHTSQDPETNAVELINTDHGIKANTNQFFVTSQDFEPNLDKLVDTSQNTKANVNQLLDTNQDSGPSINIHVNAGQDTKTNSDELLDTSHNSDGSKVEKHLCIQDSETNVDHLLLHTNQNIEAISDQLLDTCQHSEPNVKNLLETRQVSKINMDQLVDTSLDSEPKVEKILETRHGPENNLNKLLNTFPGSKFQSDQIMDTCLNFESDADQLLNDYHNFEVNTAKAVDNNKNCDVNQIMTITKDFIEHTEQLSTTPQDSKDDTNKKISSILDIDSNQNLEGRTVGIVDSYQGLEAKLCEVINPCPDTYQKCCTNKSFGPNTIHICDTTHVSETNGNQAQGINQDFEVNTDQICETSHVCVANTGQIMDISQDVVTDADHSLNITQDFESETDHKFNVSQDVETSTDNSLDVTQDVESVTDQELNVSQGMETDADYSLNITETDQEQNVSQVVEANAGHAIDINKDIESDTAQVLDVNECLETNTDSALYISQNIESDSDHILNVCQSLETDAEQDINTDNDLNITPYIESDTCQELGISQNFKSDAHQVLDVSQDMETNTDEVGEINQDIESHTGTSLYIGQDFQADADQVQDIS